MYAKSNMPLLYALYAVHTHPSTGICFWSCYLT